MFWIVILLIGDFLPQLQIMHKPDGIAYLCKIPWYCSFFHDSFDLNRISSPLYTKTLHTITNLPPYLTDGTTLSVFFPGFCLVYNQKIQIFTHLSTVHFATFSVQLLCFFYHNSFFCLFTFHNTGFFTVDSNTDCCQLKLNSAVNSGAVFLLCILISIIKSLPSAAVVTILAKIIGPCK